LIGWGGSVVSTLRFKPGGTVVSTLRFEPGSTVVSTFGFEPGGTVVTTFGFEPGGSDFILCGTLRLLLISHFQLNEHVNVGHPFANLEGCNDPIIGGFSLARIKPLNVLAVQVEANAFIQTNSRISLSCFLSLCRNFLVPIIWAKMIKC